MFKKGITNTHWLKIIWSVRKENFVSMNMVSSDAVSSECQRTHQASLICHVHARDTFKLRNRIGEVNRITGDLVKLAREGQPE